MSIAWQLQIAIYGELDSALSDPVYSDGSVPDNTDDLYVVIGNDTHIEWDTDGETGFESTVTIHTWDTRSTVSGFGGIKPLMGSVYDALHRSTTLSITGYHMVGVDCEFQETFIDADGLTAHGVQRFRIITRKT